MVVSSRGLALGTVTSTEEFPIGRDVEIINVSGFNGSITWIPIGEGEKASVVVEKEVRGVSDSAIKRVLSELNVEDRSSRTELVLKVNSPGIVWGVTSSQIRYTVYASPEQIRLFEAKTSNGKINIKADFRGTLNLKTSNGAITLNSGIGQVDIKTSNGAIDLGNTQFTKSSTIRTSNGRIEGTVSFPSSGTFSFNTSNGRIDLRMPRNTRGTFDVSTSNGKVEFRVGADVLSQKSVRIKTGTGPTISVKTSNGGISIKDN